MNTALTLALCLVGHGFVGHAKKQTNVTGPVKLAIRHADPWMVKAMIEGGQVTQPELSTLWGVTGNQPGAQSGNQGGSPLLESGFLVVNPTDNSLWWYPKKTK